MNRLQKAILRTLTYADIFDYPLKKREIWRFLIADKNYSSGMVFKNLVRALGIDQADNYYFLEGRKRLVGKRRRREKQSQAKLKIAFRVGRWLKLVPWIKMVAVTGALTMNNSEQNDDIDLLIVTVENRLWLTRLFSVFLVELTANRRHPHDREVKDKLCLNMFLDEAHLQIPKRERDLFTAHEVCQLKPLWDKDNLYQRFIQQNRWVQAFLPNWRLF